MHTVCKRSTQSLGFTDPYRMPVENLALDLHRSLFVLNIRNAIEAASVSIFIGIALEQVHRGLYSQFFTKNVSAFGTDILAIHDILRL